MDRAEAIKRLEWYQLVGTMTDSFTVGGGADREAYNMALAALREQAQREQGCEYCFRAKWISGAFSASGPADETHVFVVPYDGDVNFCPMCGRKLKEGADHE